MTIVGEVIKLVFVVSDGLKPVTANPTRIITFENGGMVGAGVITYRGLGGGVSDWISNL